MKLNKPRVHSTYHKQPVLVRVSKPTRKRLLAEMKRMETTTSEIVRCALDAYFDELDRERQEAHESLGSM